MDRQAFYNSIRGEIKLTPFAVAGIDALLDEGEKAKLSLHHMANVLANVRRETGGLMGPIKETVMPWHKDHNPSDAEVIKRLERAWKAGQLPHVKAPYWRIGEDGYARFGRGQIQLTGDENYDRFGVTTAQALQPKHSARIAVQGMVAGAFTGRKLSDYKFPDDLHNPPSRNPRRIVNGRDGSDKEVAASHLMFADALEKAGWGRKPQVGLIAIIAAILRGAGK